MQAKPCFVLPEWLSNSLRCSVASKKCKSDVAITQSYDTVILFPQHACVRVCLCSSAYTDVDEDDEGEDDDEGGEGEDEDDDEDEEEEAEAAPVLAKVSDSLPLPSPGIVSVCVRQRGYGQQFCNSVGLKCTSSRRGCLAEPTCTGALYTGSACGCMN